MTLEIDIEKIREILAYDQETGVFTWKVARGPRLPGYPIGARLRNSYLAIGMFGKTFYAHRVAWAYVHGHWPIAEIDHINGNRTDNRIKNLRQATRSLNNQNKYRAMSNSTHGVLGVHLHKGTNRWRARIAVDGKDYHLGLFDTPEKAHAAYVAAKRRLHIVGML